MRRTSIAWSAGFLLLVACGDSSGPTTGTGSIALSTVTEGLDLDANGYQVRVDSGPTIAVGINALVQVDSLRPGSHQVELQGLASNCTVYGSNPRPISVIGYQSVPLTVHVLCGGPMVIPDSTEVAFVRADGAQWDIYGMRGDGGGVVNLTNHPALESCPAWSPDGTRLAFSSDRDGNGAGEIYTVNADGSGLTRLTNHPGIDCAAGWSPDGLRIAYTLSASSVNFPGGQPAEFDIWVMNADGSNPVNLTHTTDQAEEHPSWSPDGARIAFSRQDLSSKLLDVYVMNADGSGVVNLTNTGSMLDREPAWSPDGTRIVFRNGRGGQSYDIWVMNADGSGVQQVTFLPGSQIQAAWTPDGSRIVFADGPTQIKIIKPDGSDLTTLTSGSNDSSPAWRRPRAARR